MVRSFRCKDTQALFEGGAPRRFRAIQGAAVRKLSQMDAAHSLEFLRSPPGNHLEALKSKVNEPVNTVSESIGNSAFASCGQQAARNKSKLWIITRSLSDFGGRVENSATRGQIFGDLPAHSGAGPKIDGNMDRAGGFAGRPTKVRQTPRGSNMTSPVNRMRPVHPGEILREDYLVPLGMSAHALSMALRVPATRIHAIVNERRGVTADTAERLARYFGGDATSWLNLQATYDLKTLPTRNEIMRQVEPRAA